MRTALILAFGLATASTGASATTLWVCPVVEGPTFTDVQQCNSFCVEAQGGPLTGDDDRDPIYLCEIRRPPGGGGGGGGGGGQPIEFEPVEP